MTFNKINNLQIFQKKVRKTGENRLPVNIANIAIMINNFIIPPFIIFYDLFKQLEYKTLEE